MPTFLNLLKRVSDSMLSYRRVQHGLWDRQNGGLDVCGGVAGGEHSRENFCPSKNRFLVSKADRGGTRILVLFAQLGSSLPFFDTVALAREGGGDSISQNPCVPNVPCFSRTR